VHYNCCLLWRRVVSWEDSPENRVDPFGRRRRRMGEDEVQRLWRVYWRRQLSMGTPPSIVCLRRAERESERERERGK